MVLLDIALTPETGILIIVSYMAGLLVGAFINRS